MVLSRAGKAKLKDTRLDVCTRVINDMGEAKGRVESDLCIKRLLNN